MSKKWQQDEEAFLEERLLEDPREVHVLFSEQFGPVRSLESLRKKMSRLREQEIAEQARVEDLDDTGAYTSLQLLDPSIVRQQVKLWLRYVALLRPQKVRINKKGTKKKALVLVISDVHWGKQTPGFNMKIASERLLSIPQELANRELPEFDEIRLILLGDLVEGEGIFECQANLIEAPVIAAHKKGTETCWKLACSLADTFDVPVLVETGPGNHGRTSKTAHPQSNWDNAISQSLAMISEYAQHPGVQVNLNLEDFNVVNIKGNRVLLNHAGVKHLGTPAMMQKFAGWILSKDIDILVHGHWHNVALDTYLGRTRICNGNVAGPDDLGERIAREDPPCQVYFFLDPQRPGQVIGFDTVRWG